MKKNALFLLVMLAGCSAPDDKLLFEAIRAKNTQLVARILTKKNVTLDPPQQPNQVNKPLAYAAAYGNLEIVKLILEMGANMNGQVAYGEVPLIKAAEHNNRDIIVFLIERGADVNLPNAFGVTPFIGLCASGDVDLVQLALKHGGKVNASYVNQTESTPGIRNYTALQAAVDAGRASVVNVLIEHGGDPNVKDYLGKTSHDIAKSKGDVEIQRILK